MVSIDSLRPYFEATRAMPEQKSDSGDGNSRKRELTPQVSAECRDFEQLLTDITKAFNNTAHIQFSNVMNDSLGRIARFLKCERSAVFLFGPDRNRLQVTYGWADEGIPPVQVGRYIESDLPWYASHVRSGHLLKLDTVVELPPEAACERQLLLDQGVKSHLSVPLIANGNSIGTVTFASFRFYAVLGTGANREISPGR